MRFIVDPGRRDVERSVDPPGCPWSNAVAMRLTALSPLDGRYADQLAPLAQHFSELALIRGRVTVELAYLRALAAELGRPVEVPELDFTEADGEAVKALERTT